ncbi:MAG TPA: HNH endonuclease [Verrucomicrobiae bacterium]|nr:HNH endonuclease [Verrucomicrobiae bacterium]
MAAKQRDWTREEHILAFNLYCKIPFGRIHMGNPEVIQLAKIIGRSVGSVSYKLANFSRLDPELQARGIKGMPRGARGEEAVWREFENDPESLAYESERLLAKFTGRKLEEVAQIDERELPKEGIERERMVRVRVNQHFFRTAVLSAYDYKCCITGLAVPELLVASHIIPWARDAKQRMNPRNGLCLNALHDRAFDRGCMWINAELKVCFAPRFLKDKSPTLEWLTSFNGQPLNSPRRFPPDLSLLRQHADKFSAVEK